MVSSWKKKICLFLKNIYFTFGCTGSSLLGGLPLVEVSGSWSLQCRGFSLWRLLCLRSTGSRHTSFSSCSSWAWLLISMWDLPKPGIEPVSPASAGGVLFTVPSRESKCVLCHQSPAMAASKRSYHRGIPGPVGSICGESLSSGGRK